MIKHKCLNFSVVLTIFVTTPGFASENQPLSSTAGSQQSHPLNIKALCAFTKEEFRSYRSDIEKNENSRAIDTEDLNSQIILKYFPEIPILAKSLADNLFTGLPSREGSSTLVLKNQKIGLVLTASHTAEAEDLTEKMNGLSVDYVAIPFKEYFDQYTHKSNDRSQIVSISSVTNQYLVDTPQAHRTDITIEFPAEIIYKPAFKMIRKSSYGFYTDYENIPVALDFSLAQVSLEALHNNHLSDSWAKYNDMSKLKIEYPELHRGLMGVKPLQPRDLKLSHFSAGPVFAIKDEEVMIGWGELQKSGEILIDVPVRSGVSGSGLFDCHGDFAGLIVRSTQGRYLDPATGELSAKTIAISLPLLTQSLLKDLEQRQIDVESYLSEFPLVKRLVEPLKTISAAASGGI